jgi:DNA-binding phage protein
MEATVMEEAQAATTTTDQLNIESITKEILNTIEREREREIVARRFGLFDRRETLGQIGELLGITRERVRQLEKAVITRLNESAKNGLPHIKEVEKVLNQHLEDMGKVARVSEITDRITADNSKIDQARVAFLAQLAPSVAVIEDNDHFYHAIGLASEHTEKAIREQVNKIIDAIKNIAEPTDIDTVAQKVGSENPKHIEALASISKSIANLHGRWGLVKWGYDKGTVADVIAEVLKKEGGPLHRDEIVKRVLKSRHVKETTILLNLQGKPQFKRVAKATYTLAE